MNYNDLEIRYFEEFVQALDELLEETSRDIESLLAITFEELRAEINLELYTHGRVVDRLQPDPMLSVVSGGFQSDMIRLLRAARKFALPSKSTLEDYFPAKAEVPTK